MQNVQRLYVNFSIGVIFQIFENTAAQTGPAGAVKRDQHCLGGRGCKKLAYKAIILTHIRGKRLFRRTEAQCGSQTQQEQDMEVLIVLSQGVKSQDGPLAPCKKGIVLLQTFTNRAVKDFAHEQADGRFRHTAAHRRQRVFERQVMCPPQVRLRVDGYLAVQDGHGLIQAAGGLGTAAYHEAATPPSVADTVQY